MTAKTSFKDLLGIAAQGDQQLRMRQIKNNLAMMPEPLGVEISETGISFGEAPEEAKIETVTERAMEFLRVELAHGARRAKNLIEEAELAGISTRTLQNAKKHLGVISVKTPSGWMWSFTREEPLF